MNKLFYINENLCSECIRYTICIFGIKFNFKRKHKLKGNPVIFLIAYSFSLNGGKKSKIVKNASDHKKNIDILKKNLSADSLNNLNKILERINKILYAVKNNIAFDDNYIYSNDELLQLEKIKKMKNEIIQKENYYQYKDYKLPRSFFSPSVFVYKHGIDTLKTFNNIGNKTILDVGTCTGDSILVFRKYLKNNIIGFEPVKATYEIAQNTLKLNNIQNAKIEQIGLGAKEEDIEICIFPEQPEYSSIECRKSTNKETVKIRTLDSYVKENNLQVGLIKVDVEGFEPHFLKGAINTLKEQKPILLLSIYHNYHDFYKIKPWIEDLNLGYKFDFFKGIDGDPVGETLLICEVY